MRKFFFPFLLLFAIGGCMKPTPSAKNTFRIMSEPDIVGFAPLDNMPIVKGGYGEFVSQTEAPVEQRGEEYRRWLAASVKISVSGGSGSGTICYYDASKNLAYVASCGHLWDNGAMTVEEGLGRNIKCKITIWYKNEEKLPSTKQYDAKVIFYSHRSGCDTSLATFQPDYVPNYYPIAPVNYDIRVGSRQHSCGCDGGREVAHYDVEIVGEQGSNLITKHNSPRPGRSGGGLLTQDGYYIGTCWGNSQVDGSGIGYFTPLSVIHQYWSQQAGYEFLLRQQPGSNIAARQLPVINRRGPQAKFPKDYIPLPGLR